MGSGEKGKGVKEVEWLARRNRKSEEKCEKKT